MLGSTAFIPSQRLGVDVHDAIPDVLRNVDGGVAGNGDARIVDEDVDGAEAVQRIGDEAVPCGDIANIHRRRERDAAGGGYVRGDLIGAFDVDQHDRSAVLGKLLRRRPADAVARAGHDCHLAIEVSHVARVLWKVRRGSAPRGRAARPRCFFHARPGPKLSGFPRFWRRRRRCAVGLSASCDEDSRKR
jgi:hypothetical protein